MTPGRRIILIAAVSAALVVGGITLLNGRRASGPGAAPEPPGNYDSATRSLISSRERVVFLVPFSHWDTDWHQDFDAYSKLADQNILRAIELAKQDSRYRYVLEQVLFVQHFWESHPASRADLVTLVHKRQITFAWGGITQPETSLAAPSIQVRNLELGEKWIGDTFGAEYVPHTAWQSDAFGNSASFATFLNQFGISYLFIGRHQGRCDPDYRACQPLPPLFYWSAPATSPGLAGRVLVAYVSYPTAWGDIYQQTGPHAQLSALRKTIEDEFKGTGSRYLFLPVGFDFFDPQANLLPLVDRWNASDRKTALVLSDPESAFEYLATQPLPDMTVDMNPIWQAFYNSRPEAKIADKESEYYLTAADKFGLLVGAPVSAGWDTAAINAHYDNISGVSFDSVWQSSQRPRFQQAVATAKKDLADVVAQLSNRVAASLVVFNPTSWQRSEVVEITGSLADSRMLPAPVQQIGTNRFAFQARDIPALGYAALSGGTSLVEHPVSVIRIGNQVTLRNDLVSVTIDGDHGGAFSSLTVGSATESTELLTSFGDDVTYWNDSGDVYGAFFGNVRARESEITATLAVIASGPLIARVQAAFSLGGQEIVKTVTLRANDPLVEVELVLRALPETTAIALTSTRLQTDMRTDDLGFGAFTHQIDTRPIAPGDVTYRRSIFYPITYWSDVSAGNLGLTLITHGLQGVSGGAQRGVMLVREVTQDPEGVADSEVHHLRYAYLPHMRSAMDAQSWRYAYQFNQPLIVTRKAGEAIQIQFPWDEEPALRKLEDLQTGSPLPPAFSLLRAKNAVVADLHREGDEIEAVILNYNPARSTSLQVEDQNIALPGSVLSLMYFSSSSLGVPLGK